MVTFTKWKETPVQFCLKGFVAGQQAPCNHIQIGDADEAIAPVHLTGLLDTVGLGDGKTFCTRGF